MTGEKNRFSTHEKLWKLDDTTLSTPKHDEMVLFLLNDKNVLKLFPVYSELKPEQIKFVSRGEVMDMDMMYIWYQRTPNHPRLIGYKADIMDVMSDVFAFSDFDTVSRVIIKSEVPIKANNGFLIGYWDIIINPFVRDFEPETKEFIYKWNPDFPKLMFVNKTLTIPYHSTAYCKPVYIEVKPEIKSFGETLRQLNTYRNYIPNSSSVYLFTKDLRFKDAFESQGIKVLEYKNGM